MRIRISYKKGTLIRFTSALDLQRIWERSCRRASINITYSKGFHPQPRIQLGIPLPLGFIGLNEKVDIWIENSISLEEISTRLERNIPEGIEINSIQEVDISEKALSTQIQYSDYRVYLLNETMSNQSIQNKITNLLNKKEIIRKKRNGKKYHLRPLIICVDLIKENLDTPFIYLRLLSQQNKTGRADEVLLALGFSLTDFIVERTGSYT